MPLIDIELVGNFQEGGKGPVRKVWKGRSFGRAKDTFFYLEGGGACSHQGDEVEFLREVEAR